MERTYWPAWEKFLNRNGLIPLVRDLLRDGRSLVMLLSQLMVLGVPLVRSFSWGHAYMGLVATLGEDEKIDAFSKFLREAGG